MPNMPVRLLILLWRRAIAKSPQELARKAKTLMPSKTFSSGLSQAFAFDLLRLAIASNIHSF